MTLLTAIRLNDGRQFAYAEYGVPHGQPIFFFHGFGDSRLFGRLLHEDALRHQVRLIAPERPGYGLSDFQPGRTIFAWVHDIAELTKALGIERFAAIGFSGGCPYVLACASHFSERLTVAGLLGGIAPQDMPETRCGMTVPVHTLLALARRSPRLVEMVLHFVRMMWHFQLCHPMPRLLPKSERQLYMQPDVVLRLLDNSRVAFRQGTRGAAWDVALLARPWGFALSTISQPVLLWHGEADLTVPVFNGHYLAHSLPDCTPQFPAHERHLSMLVSHFSEILETVSMMHKNALR